MKVKRITGFDIAAGLLIPVALYYFFHLGIGQNKDSFRRDQFNLIFDGAVAAFVFLNGLTIGLSVAGGDGINGMQKYLIRRGLVFVGIGCLLDLTGMPHIFTLLGLLSMAASAFVPLSSLLLRVFTTVLLIIAFYIYFLTDIRINVDPFGGGSAVHFLAHHGVYGYYSVLSWAPFFLGGVLFSRRLLDRHFKPGWASAGRALTLAGLGIIAEILLNERFPNLGGIAASPYPFMQAIQFLYPSFMLTAFGLCLVIGNLTAGTGGKSTLQLAATLKDYGRLKYSVLMAATVGAWLASLLLSGIENFGYRTIALFTLLVWGITLLGSALWLRFFSAGPVEMLLRYIAPGK